VTFRYTTNQKVWPVAVVTSLTNIAMLNNITMMRHVTSWYDIIESSSSCCHVFIIFAFLHNNSYSFSDTVWYLQLLFFFFFFFYNCDIFILLISLCSNSIYTFNYIINILDLNNFDKIKWKICEIINKRTQNKRGYFHVDRLGRNDHWLHELVYQWQWT
jgi:hypothetical protein